MAKREDYVYVTGDDTYVYDEPATTGRSFASKAASIAILASGLAIGIAFNPAAALFTPNSASGTKVNPQAAQQDVAGSQDVLTLPNGVANTELGFSSESFSLSTNGAYKVPSQQFTSGSDTPSFGNLSSATPTGSSAWSDEDDEDDDDDDDDRGEHDDDRGEHDD
jgi:hypothetical protein